MVAGMVRLRHASPSAAMDNNGVNWRRIVLAGAVVSVSRIGACGWFAYHWIQPREIEIRNNSRETIFVRGTPEDICPATLIGGEADGVYKDDWFLCREPRLNFSSPLIGTIECDWDQASQARPVVVIDVSVSCSEARVPVFLTPISPPAPRHFPSPTPER
jgi:hypothetical protein